MYVDRDGSNKITAAFAMPQRPNHEQVDDAAPELTAFLVPPPPTADQLEAKGQTVFAADRTLMAVTKVVAKEINALRTQAGLAPFTVAQWLAKFAAAYGGKAIP